MRPFHSPFAAVVFALVLPAVALRADAPLDFKSHFFLKHLVGDWITEGELKAPDGNVLKVHEEWKAEVLGETTMVIEGRRELNGQGENYKWTITRDPSSGLFEAAHRASEASPDTQRFEIQFSEAEMKMEWTGFLGSDNAKAVLVDTFKKGEHDAFEGTVTLTDGAGATTLSGTLRSKRIPKP